MKHRVIRVMWCTFAGLIGLLILLVVSMWNGWLGGMPDLYEMQNPIDKFATQIYTSDGKLMGTWNKAGANRIYISYYQLPPALVHGLVATEDERFYEHSGVDFIALGRSIVKRVAMGQKSAGGGSTITQQLAKQLFSEQSHTTLQRAMRKPFEWLIAIKLERLYTKEEIITMYLNYFDFLHNANGIKNASETYFSKEPKDLTINECATLVGMCKNPSYYNPVRYKDRTQQRRNVVLQQMCKNGYISESEMTSLSQEPLVLKYHKLDHRDGIAVYLREYLRQIMMATKPDRKTYPSWNMSKYYEDSLAWEEDALYGWCNKNRNNEGKPYNIYTDGLKVYTTIDSRMQDYAEQACREHVADYLQQLFSNGTRKSPYNNITQKEVDAIMKRSMRNSDRYRNLKQSGMGEQEIFATFFQPEPMSLFTYNGDKEVTMTPYDSILYYKNFLRCGFMCMEPTNGAVRAYVGGLDYEHFSYDMAMEGRRQIGSTMKPYLFALAMENGWMPSDVVPAYRQTYTSSGEEWTPRGTSRGAMSLRSALAWSNNHAAAYLMSKLDPHQLVELLHNFGIRNDKIPPYISLCLGPCDIKVGEMVSGYSAFINHGVRTAPVFVSKIVDGRGNVVATFKPQMSEVISSTSSYKMITMMRAVVDNGTGRRMRSYYSGDMIGKTGTTNSNSDAWFMGCTPELICGVWVGGEDRDIHFNSTIGQGSSAALPVVGIFLKKVYDNRELPYDSRMEFDIPKDFDPNMKSKHESDDIGIDEIYE